jgi:double-stranded uracil-DNA glycosylase
MDLSDYYGATVPDLLPDPLKLLFVGINPSLMSAAMGSHFARKGNRFWPALHRAGITKWRIDASEGFRPEDEAHLRERGVGITNIVPVATARADELTKEQIEEGLARLRELVERRRPAVVAIVGITAWRQGTGRKKAAIGWQESPWEDVSVFVAPNPSGLNAHYQVPDLARAYGEAALKAGVIADLPADEAPAGDRD